MPLLLHNLLLHNILALYMNNCANIFAMGHASAPAYAIPLRLR